RVRTLAARTLNRLLIRANAAPTIAVWASVPHESPGLTQGAVTSRASQPTKADRTKFARLNNTPYHGTSPRKSLISKVPKHAIQQTANGLAIPVSKSAASSG